MQGPGVRSSIRCSRLGRYYERRVQVRAKGRERCQLRHGDLLSNIDLPLWVSCLLSASSCYHFVFLFRLLLLLVLLHLFLVSFSFLLFDRNCVVYRSGGADGPAVVVTFMMLMMLMMILTYPDYNHVAGTLLLFCV